MPNSLFGHPSPERDLLTELDGPPIEPDHAQPADHTLEDAPRLLAKVAQEILLVLNLGREDQREVGGR